MNSYEEEETKRKKEEEREADKILLIIFGIIILIISLMFESKLPIESDFIKIEGTLKENIVIRTGLKSQNNYFAFKLKEDIYRKARFEANSIFFLIDRKELIELCKKETTVSFHVLKKRFNDNFSIQHNDVYGSKKLKECFLEPFTLTVNNRVVFSFRSYLDYQKEEKSSSKIIIPILSIIMILGGIYYDKLGKLYYQRIELFLILIFLAALILNIYMRYFLHKQY